MGFEHPEDRAFFVQLLCADGETVDGYAFLFDFRDPVIKRREFNSVRPSLVLRLKEVYGTKCMLQFSPICAPDTEASTIDHVIPLSLPRH